MKKHLFAVSLVLSLGLVATACGGGGGGGGGTSPEPSVKGGVLRESLTDFGFTNAFDPTGEYLGSAWGYYAQMLIRGLVSYPFVSGAAGNEIQADLATDTGTLSADGWVEFVVEAKIVDWEVEPGKIVQAWTYNGVVPAPEIHVHTGDKVRIIFTNSLPQTTSLHLHGIKVPNVMDGVEIGRAHV